MPPGPSGGPLARPDGDLRLGQRKLGIGFGPEASAAGSKPPATPTIGDGRGGEVQPTIVG